MLCDKITQKTTNSELCDILVIVKNVQMIWNQKEGSKKQWDVTVQRCEFPSLHSHTGRFHGVHFFWITAPQKREFHLRPRLGFLKVTATSAQFCVFCSILVSILLPQWALPRLPYHHPPFIPATDKGPQPEFKFVLWRLNRFTRARI